MKTLDSWFQDFVADGGLDSVGHEDRLEALQSRFKKPATPAILVPFSGPRMMTPQQASEYICRSIDVIYEMIKNREIPVIPNGRHYTIDRLDLDRWIEKNKQGVMD